MEIYLVRHGEAFTKEEDSERHLNRDGVNQCRLTGKALKRLDTPIDLIISSPKLRARQTAEIIAEEVGYSKKEIKTTETLEPTAPPGETISYLNKFPGIQSVMLTGHLPLLGYLASELMSNVSDFSFNFKSGAVCKINIGQPGSRKGELCWFLEPQHLRLIAQA